MTKRFNIDQLPRNDKKSKNITPIVNARRRPQRRRSSRLATHIQSIGNSLFSQLILPSIRDTAVEFFTEAVTALIRGEEPEGFRHKPRQRSRRAYNRMYDEPRRSSRPSHRRRRSRHEEDIRSVYDDIVFDSRDVAEEVLGQMLATIAEYGSVTVGDLHNLCGLDYNHTYENYGWSSLRGTRVIRSRHGGEYLIDFPDAEYF